MRYLNEEHGKLETTVSGNKFACGKEGSGFGFGSDSSGGDLASHFHLPRLGQCPARNDDIRHNNNKSGNVARAWQPTPTSLSFV